MIASVNDSNIFIDRCDLECVLYRLGGVVASEINFATPCHCPAANDSGEGLHPAVPDLVIVEIEGGELRQRPFADLDSEGNDAGVTDLIYL